MNACPHCGRMFPASQDRCPDDHAWLVAAGDVGGPGEQFLGRTLGGRYRLDRRLGAGSVGVVFCGLDLALNQTVAIKLLMPRGFAEPRASRRLKREFRALSRLDNPHIVKALELGETEEGIPYLAMEYVEGRNLDQLLEDEISLTPTRALHLLTQLLEALGHAHEQGVVHRDLKPDNVHLAPVGGDPDYVKVLDFGLVKFFQIGEARPTALTAAHLVVGTPHYMAPEQIRGGEIGPWTDLYALGTLLYRAVTGQLPFPGNDPVRVMGAHCRQAPVPPRLLRPELPTDLEILILDLLEKDPTFRPRSAETVLQRLEQGELASLRRQPWAQQTSATPRDAPGTPREAPGTPAPPAWSPPAAPARPRTLAFDQPPPPDQAPADPVWRAPAARPGPARPAARRASLAPPQPRTPPPAQAPRTPGYLWLVALSWALALATAIGVVLVLRAR